jgi:hypothetical protein
MSHSKRLLEKFSANSRYALQIKDDGIQKFLTASSYVRPMGQLKPVDTARELDRKARLEGWPLRCDGTLEFERTELKELRDLWRSLAAGKIAPSRTDFDARTLKPFLRNIRITERVFTGPGSWRYRTRLAGTAVSETIGDATGKFLEEQFAPEFVPRWASVYDATLDGGQPLRLTGEFEQPELAFLCGEALTAPLVDNNGKLTLVLGCMYFRPKPSLR